MIAGTPVLDLDDAASITAADGAGLLRSAASGGAQVRATAAAVTEHALATLPSSGARSLVIVTGSGRAARAAALLIAALGPQSGLPVVPVSALPAWVGALDVVLVAGDDAGDPRLLEAVDRAQRRGAEVVVAAPIEGPLAAATGGRAALLEPRVPVLDHNRLLRYFAAGLAVLAAIDPGRAGVAVPDLDKLADILDAEALRDGPEHEVFHNPAKTLAARMRQHRVVFSGDSPATAALAGHAAEVLLQAAGQIATAVNLAEAVAAQPRLVAVAATAAPDFDPLFHDEELDGPAPVERVRIFVLSADADQAAAGRRIARFGGDGAGPVDAELVNAEVDLLHSGLTDPAAPATPAADAAPSPGRGGEVEQLAVLALRLEMAAAYLGLLAAPGGGAPDRYDGGRF